jgi:hypothetical protein
VIEHIIVRDLFGSVTSKRDSSAEVRDGLLFAIEHGCLLSDNIAEFMPFMPSACEFPSLVLEAWSPTRQVLCRIRGVVES